MAIMPEFMAEAGPGDYVPPFVPHQDNQRQPRRDARMRDHSQRQRDGVVNLDIEPVEKPENVPWIDPIHKA